MTRPEEPKRTDTAALIEERLGLWFSGKPQGPRGIRGHWVVRAGVYGLISTNGTLSGKLAATTERKK